MISEAHHRNSSTSTRRLRLRAATTALAVGTLLLSASTASLSQENEAAKPPAETVLYTFTGGADGRSPSGMDTGLVRDKEGNLYGTTSFGGASDIGVVFKVDPDGNETVLHSFTGAPDGDNPMAGLIRDEEGNLYGTTFFGGSGNAPGTVFKVDRAGNEMVLHSFNGADGQLPDAGLTRDEEGNLYSTTPGGGASGKGVVFRLELTGELKVLYSFTGGADGGTPEAGLVRDEEGNLYGTTFGGGSGAGVVFKLDRNGKETVLHSFTEGAEGGQPLAGLVRDEEGNLYGTTGGGVSQSGVVFKLAPTGKLTVLYSFSGGTNGAGPSGRLLRCGGTLYGVTSAGGDLKSANCNGRGCGVVFKVDRAGKETVLYTFHGLTDGAGPLVGLVPDRKGNLYGTTQIGGDLSAANCPGFGCGVVFKVKADAECRDSQERSEELHSQHD